MPSSTYVAIGAMDQWVTVQTPVTTADGSGGTAVTWPPSREKTLPARVLPMTLSERERLASLQITATQSYRVVMRYRTDLTVQHRLRWREKTLQIHTVTDDQSDKRRLVLECTEVQT